MTVNLRAYVAPLCLFALIALFTSAACNRSEGTAAHATPGETLGKIKRLAANENPEIVCTIGMVADLARRVGGEHVQVMQLMGQGVDPHLYKASPGDVKQLYASSFAFYSGLHLEGKMVSTFEKLASNGKAIAVTSRVEESRLLDAGGVHDPHVWFDVKLWSEGVNVVRDALVALDPPHAEAFRTNAEAYLKEMTVLDAEVRANLSEIPKDQRVLVTAHDAFQYFGRAYDIEVKSIQGISTESEAGVREINALVDFIIKRGVKAVFVESSVSDRNIRALIEGCTAQGHTVKIGGELFSDAMGPEGSETGTYPGMVRHNVKLIVESLK